MKKTFKHILKWFLRIFLGLVSLIVLLVLLFYLFRGIILDKALNHINESQPGELRLEKLDINPFIDFPAMSLLLKELEFLPEKSASMDQDTLPVARLGEVYVSLDVIKLIRGKYKVSTIRLGDGELNYIVGGDSISNLEKALGTIFGQGPEKDSLEQDSSILSFDLEKIEVRNLTMNYYDQPGKTKISLKINGMESGISYYPDTISANVMLHMDLNEARYEEMLLDNPRSVSLNVSAVYDQIGEKVTLGRSALAVNETIFKLEGNADLAREEVDLVFSAENKGIELLNFLLNGILDISAIEQIGDGLISLNGDISGSYKNKLPELKVNFSASDVGFRVHAINQSVTNIAFEGFASNGSAKDFSEAQFQLNNLHLDFPQGEVNANVQFANLVKPDIQFELDGNVDLSILNEIIKSDAIGNMHGNLNFNGAVDGIFDNTSETFLEDAGSLAIDLKDVSFLLPDHKIDNIEGRIVVGARRISLQDMNLSADSNDLHLDGEIENLAPWLLGYAVDPGAEFHLEADELYYYKLLGDSIYSDPFEGINLSIDLKANGAKLKRALEQKELPELSLSLSEMNVKIPGYAPLSQLNFELEMEDRLLRLHDFKANVGSSDLELDLEILNYKALIEKDSLANIVLAVNMGSRSLRLRDLLTIDGEFTALPENFIDEQLTDFKFDGKVETMVGELLKNNGIPDFKFVCGQLESDFKYYPLSLKDFMMDVIHEDSLLMVNNFSGAVGNNNIALDATLYNLFDSSRVIAGSVNLHSDLLDINELMDYELIAAEQDADTSATDKQQKSAPGLSNIDYPDLALNIDLEEFKFDQIELFAVNGKLRLKPYKIIYLDRFALQTETGGSVVLDGMFNVADPSMYVLSAAMRIDTLNMSDFDVQVTMKDSVYSLEENFNGILSANGMAEFFINPDLTINIDTSTAMINIILRDGRVRNFAPLQAIGNYVGNKDLNNVQFGELRNSFTLSEGGIQIPLMSISSTLGLFLIEGEQGLGGDFLYLARVPLKLVGETAWNVLSNQKRKEPEEEGTVETLVLQKFAILTVAGVDGEVEVKKGDKRDEYK